MNGLKSVAPMFAQHITEIVARAKNKAATAARQIKIRKLKLISDDGIIQVYQTHLHRIIKFNKETFEFFVD